MWKNDSPPIMPFGHYKKNCGDASSAKEFSDCVKNKTLNLNEVVVNATQGFSSNIIKKLELSDSDLWTSDMTISVSGRCYTLNYDKQLKVDKETNSIIINLVPTNYYLFLHDPDFFFPTINPRTLPLNLIMVNPQELGNTSYLTLTIEVIQKQNLNRAEVPCNHSPGYNFTACIKRSLARMVNCTLPWNDEIRGTEPGEFNRYTMLFSLQVLRFVPTWTNLRSTRAFTGILQRKTSVMLKIQQDAFTHVRIMSIELQINRLYSMSKDILPI